MTTEKPKICTIGKMIYPLELGKHQQDLQVYKALVGAFENIFLIVQSPDRLFHSSRYQNIEALLAPSYKNQLINHLMFVIKAVTVGRRLNRENKIDLFIASEPTAGGVAGVVLKWLTRKKLLVQLQGDLFNLPSSEFSWLRRNISRRITVFVSKRADKVRCVSKALIEQAKKAGIPEGKLALVPSRCDVKKFDPDDWRQEGEKLREELGLTDKKVLVFVGTLSVHKGVAYLIEALPKVAEIHPDVCLLIIGSGDLEEELKRLSRDLKVADMILFLGRIPHEQVPAYLATADIFILPSLDEGMPRVVMEAMAMKLPMVASSVGGVPELIKDEETGFLVPPADPQALANALRALLASDEKAYEMGERGRKIIVENYSFEKGIEQYKGLILRMLSG